MVGSRRTVHSGWSRVDSSTEMVHNGDIDTEAPYQRGPSVFALSMALDRLNKDCRRRLGQCKDDRANRFNMEELPYPSAGLRREER